MRTFCVCCGLLLLFSFSAVAEATSVDLTIEGIDGDAENNVDAFLASIPEKDYSTDLRFRRRVKKKIIQALNALGYYHPNIHFSVEDDDELIATVSKGEPTRITTLDFQLLGDASKDKDFLTLIQHSHVKENDIINHGEYESLKQSIQSLALQKGYFNSRFLVKKIEVSLKKNEAYVTLHFDSGKRYSFGRTTIKGSQIDLKRLSSLQPYHHGDPYQLAQVGTFSQHLSDTNWFSSVMVEPDLSVLDDDNAAELPMKVTLVPAARNKLETGIGYSTDVQTKVTLKWKKPWLNRYGHSFSSSFSLSKPEQTISAGYKIPLEDVLHEYYQIQYGLKKVDNLDTQSLESNVSLERHWDLDNGWNKTVFIRYLIEDYEQGILDDTGQFLLPGVTFTRIRTRNDGRLLTWGDKQTVTLEYGNATAISETDLFRVQGSSSWIRTYADNHRGLIRFSGGANVADDFEKVVPSLRFFAGGDNSIRGYSYESISPKDESGSLTGAKYLLTSTVEYQYRLVNNWWLAAFYDYGDAFNDSPDWKRGAGVGARWVSPIGPLRLDFAWGLDGDAGKQFKIHFTLGPEL